MLLAQFLVFIPIALLLALTPGPDNLAVLSLGISRGRAASLGFALGCAAGCLTHTLLAVLGVSAMIAASPLAFGIMQYAGAAYLVWLGVHALRDDKGIKFAAGTDAPRGEPGDFRRHFTRGLIANAINPKVAMFFLAFLPQFVRHDAGSTAFQLAALGVSFGLCAALVFGLLAVFAARFGALLGARPQASRWLNRFTGLVFVGLGLRLALGDICRSR